MATSSNGSGSAEPAEVVTGEIVPSAVQRAREAHAEQCERAVGLIEAKIAGMKESLAAAKAELKLARAAAQDGA